MKLLIAFAAVLTSAVLTIPTVTAADESDAAAVHQVAQVASNTTAVADA